MAVRAFVIAAMVISTMTVRESSLNEHGMMHRNGVHPVYGAPADHHPTVQARRL